MAILVFDIGGTTMRVGISTDGKHLGRVRTQPTPRNWRDGIDWLVHSGKILAAGKKITRVSGGIAGPLDVHKQTIVNAPNLGNWNQQPIARTLKQYFRVPVRLENDAALAGLAEARRGAGKGKRVVAFLTLSTGVGGARMVDGQLDVHTYGFEPGKIIIHDQPLEVLEDWAGAGLRRRYEKPAEEITNAEVWRMVTRRMAIGLHDVIVLWNPEVIVLGGSLMKRLSVTAITAQLKKIHKTYPTIPPIRRGTFGDHAGLIGALEQVHS